MYQNKIEQYRIRILIVSNTPWNDDNSFGNSFSNIFGGNYYEIANVYCQAGYPKTAVCKRFFQISEKDILRVIAHKQKESGKEIFLDEPDSTTVLSDREKTGYDKIRRLRWQIFFWIKDIIWATKKWKSKSLDDFIDSVHPDLIFQPVYYSSYIGEIGLYAKKRAKVPMVGYISDDNYTLKQFSLSPFFWIDRLIKRYYVRRVINNCKILYTITETQRDEYNQIFGDKCKLLYKGGSFEDEKQDSSIHNPIKFVYTGNLGDGRWRTLADIARAINKVNESEIKAQLFIYSATPLSQKALNSLNIENSSFFMGSVRHEEIKSIQTDSDILIHVESFKLNERYHARLSFSTKIVDYMEAGKCILAVGWEKSGAIVYLKKYQAALVVTDPKMIESSIVNLVTNPSLINEYAQSGYQCGVMNHKIKQIRKNLYKDLLSVIR